MTTAKERERKKQSRDLGLKAFSTELTARIRDKLASTTSFSDRDLQYATELTYTFLVDISKCKAKKNPSIVDAGAPLIRSIEPSKLVPALEAANLPPSSLKEIKRWVDAKIEKTWATRYIAKLVGLSPERIRQFAEQGIAGTKIEGRWRFCKDDIDRIKRAQRPVGMRHGS